MIVLEGAGCPVELNLMARDFVNLKAARARRTPAWCWWLDIDKGGVFAQALGTLDLLPAADRARVLGLVVNRFRGDPALFEDGIRMLEQLLRRAGAGAAALGGARPGRGGPPLPHPRGPAAGRRAGSRSARCSTRG